MPAGSSRVFAPKGVIEDPVELEFVVHAIEVSRAVPDFLSALAMDRCGWR